MNNPMKRPQPSGSERSATLPILAKSALVTVLLAAAIAMTSYALPIGIAQQGDEVSTADQQARLETFRSLAPLDLSQVSAADTDRAIQSMQLNPVAAASLRTDLASTASQSAQPAPVSSPQNLPGTQQTSPQVAPAQPQTRRTRLVWITLWDTDVEDGDVVRIDSQGYSRTIRLTKKGDTFAVPVPASGVIQVTGVNDGDGGGITVGLASGGAKVVFPVMSEGQVLGLRVKVN